MRRAPLYALFLADTISLVGNVVAQLAVTWFVLVTTGSPALVSLVVFFNFLPVVLAAFFGGAVVDRVGFRTMSVAADLASAAAVAAIPLLHSTVGLPLWALLALVFAGAFFDAPGATARISLFPDLVERAGMGMERANGIRSAIQQGSYLIGAPIGGILVSAIGATNALWLDAGSFLVSAALVVGFVPAARRQQATEKRERYLTELAEGLRFVWSRPLIRALVLTILVTNFLDAPFTVVMPVYVEHAFGSAAYLGVLYGVFGGFALAGSLAFGALGSRLPRRLTFVGCFAFFPLAYLVLATLPPLGPAVAALAVSGFAAGPVNPLVNTVLFEIVPVGLRGRVFGAVRGGAWASIPLGVLLGGVIVGALGAGAAFLLIGLCYLVVTGYGFFNHAFREMDAQSGAAGLAGGGVT